MTLKEQCDGSMLMRAGITLTWVVPGAPDHRRASAFIGGFLLSCSFNRATKKGTADERRYTPPIGPHDRNAPGTSHDFSEPALHHGRSISRDLVPNEHLHLDAHQCRVARLVDDACQAQPSGMCDETAHVISVRRDPARRVTGRRQLEREPTTSVLEILRNHENLLKAKGFETIISGHADKYPALNLNTEDMVGYWRWEEPGQGMIWVALRAYYNGGHDAPQSNLTIVETKAMRQTLEANAATEAKPASMADALKESGRIA